MPLTIKSAIIGITGYELTQAEQTLLAGENPLGVILFARNCDQPQQMRRLTQSIRQALGRADAPILIDQEGGRVQRLRPPHWPSLPAAAQIGALYDRDPDAGLAAARLMGQILGEELSEIGINVDCAPVLDLAYPNTNPVIGDRAFHADPAIVYLLAAAVMAGMREFGVMAVVKHAPGHGRAQSDSHHELPRIDCAIDVLIATDFKPFIAFGKDSATLAAWAMTAHICYEAIDHEYPVTLSAPAITRILRQTMAWELPIISDDLGMKAVHNLSPYSSNSSPDNQGRINLDPTKYDIDADDKAVDWAQLVKLCLAAGCDIVLHCSGKIAETAAILAATPPIAAASWLRIERSWRNLAAENSPDSAKGLTQCWQKADKLWQMLG
ncbi:MAG: beta-N-acetylhexosaminidase [Candidatus Symbiobacter sp.]|nr:beta-N-acetylhexosaminidase [Candidatus Symbiobacter sp.]